jgi:hypothetical protein
MNTNHMAIPLVVLMAVCIQGADVILRPGKTQEMYGNETASSAHDVHHYVMKTKLVDASATSFRYTDFFPPLICKLYRYIQQMV